MLAFRDAVMPFILSNCPRNKKACEKTAITVELKI